MCTDKEKNEYRANELKNMEKAAAKFDLRIENMLHTELWIDHFATHFLKALTKYKSEKEGFYLIAMHGVEYHLDSRVPKAQTIMPKLNTEQDQYIHTEEILIKFRNDISEDTHLGSNNTIDISLKQPIYALDYIIDNNPKTQRAGIILLTKSIDLFLLDKIILYNPNKYYNINEKMDVQIKE